MTWRTTLWNGPAPSVPDDLLPLLETLTSIGAPTGAEGRRADFIQQWLAESVGLIAERDTLHNLVYDLSGGRSELTLLDAHTDTVFPDQALTVTKDGNRWSAPGIYDNTLCCVQLMMWLRAVARWQGTLPFLVSFTVGEEGTGDLRGIRAVVEHYGERLTEACIFDLGLDKITMQAVGSVRWVIRFQAAGGHSWGAFGQPSAVHAAAKWVAGLADRFAWRRNENSYNAGIIRGGTGVNAIAEQAEVVLDLRSIDPEELERRARALEADWVDFAKQEDVAVTAEQIGFRPAGHVPPDARVVRSVRTAIEQLGRTYRAAAGSNNANAVLAAAIPATCTGLGDGGGVHTREEYLDITSVEPGWHKLCLVTAACLD